ncbi:MAG: glycosyltransferase [Alphaproteobacteria bacterium]|nr:glycosyltransferase [Alphaproteobacteria bacterium]
MAEAAALGRRSVGLVIVAYKSARFAERLKRAVDAQTLRPDRILVVENGSPGAERIDPAHLPDGAELIPLENNIGFAAANNLAAARLDTEWVALLNPDAFPDPDWLERLIAASDAFPLAAAIGSLQISASDPARIDGAGDGYFIGGAPWRGGHGHALGHLPRYGEAFSPCAAAALYRRADWSALGGFDERFFCYCEDVDLGFRLRLAGRAIVQALDARVVHVGGGSSEGRSTFTTYHNVRNMIWTHAKNMPAPALWLCLPAQACAVLAALVRAAARGETLAALRGVRDAVSGMGPILETRRAVQAGRVAPLKEILRAMSWSPWALARKALALRPVSPSAHDTTS